MVEGSVALCRAQNGNAATTASEAAYSPGAKAEAERRLGRATGDDGLGGAANNSGRPMQVLIGDALHVEGCGRLGSGGPGVRDAGRRWEVSNRLSGREMWGRFVSSGGEGDGAQHAPSSPSCLVEGDDRSPSEVEVAAGAKRGECTSFNSTKSQSAGEIHKGWSVATQDDTRARQMVRRDKTSSERAI